jgi:hypothetical protein
MSGYAWFLCCGEGMGVILDANEHALYEISRIVFYNICMLHYFYEIEIYFD